MSKNSPKPNLSLETLWLDAAKKRDLAERAWEDAKALADMSAALRARRAYRVALRLLRQYERESAVRAGASCTTLRQG